MNEGKSKYVTAPVMPKGARARQEMRSKVGTELCGDRSPSAPLLHARAAGASVCAGSSLFLTAKVWGQRHGPGRWSSGLLI